MSVFIDTSAIMAILNPLDINYPTARQIWTRLVTEQVTTTTTNYVLLETFAFLQNRQDLPAVHACQEGIVPLLQIVWVNSDLHHAALGDLFIANRRGLSLVDCSSFETLRRLGIRDIVAFDRHFTDQGFHCLSN
jgi:predicted nucleic acid-binding protein